MRTSIDQGAYINYDVPRVLHQGALINYDLPRVLPHYLASRPGREHSLTMTYLACCLVLLCLSTRQGAFINHDLPPLPPRSPDSLDWEGTIH